MSDNAIDLGEDQRCPMLTQETCELMLSWGSHAFTRPFRTPVQ